MAHNNAKSLDCWSRKPKCSPVTESPGPLTLTPGIAQTHLCRRLFKRPRNVSEILGFGGFLNLELVLFNRHIYHQRKLFPPQDCIDPRPNSNLTHPSHPIGMVLYLGDKLFSFTKTYFHNFTNPRSVRCSLGSPVRVRTAQQISA